MEAGIDVRASGSQLTIREELRDGAGDLLVSGTATVEIFEVQDDGTLEQFDFNSTGSFVTTVPTTATASLTHRTTQSAGHNTGIWTYVRSDVSAFVRGRVYIYTVTHSGGYSFSRSFQFGGAEGDLLVSAAGRAEADLKMILADAQSATDLKDFADAGYDPATNKVEGVKLTDTLTTYTGNTVQTGDGFARLGAPAGASISADIAAIEDVVDAEIPAILAVVTDMTDGNTAIKNAVNAVFAKVDTEVATIISELGNGTYGLAAIETLVDELETRLTAARAGYLDNLNVGGNVASSAEATAIQNNTRVVRVVPDVIERPDSGTVTYRVEVLLYDDVGNMEAPDSAPTITLVNQAGTDRSSRLDSTTMALVSTGRYRAIYTADVADTLEQLVWTFSVVEGGNTRLYGNGSVIVDTTAVDFTAADRTKLEAIHIKLPSKSNLTGTNNSDGDIQLDEATGVPVDSAGVGTLLTRLGSPVGVSVSADVAAVQADTDNLQTRIPAALVGGRMDSSVGAVAAGAITAAAIATDAIDADAIAADVTTELQAGLATSAALAAVATNAATAATQATAGAASALSADGKLTAGRMTTLDDLGVVIEDDGGDRRFTLNALELAPTGGAAPTAAAIADAVWDEALADHDTVGSTGEALADIEAGLDALDNVELTVVSPVIDGDDVTLAYSFDYFDAEGMEIGVTLPAGDDLTAVGITLQLLRARDADPVLCTTTATAARALRIEFSQAQVQALGRGSHLLNIQSTRVNTHKVFESRITINVT